MAEFSNFQIFDFFFPNFFKIIINLKLILKNILKLILKLKNIFSDVASSHGLGTQNNSWSPNALKFLLILSTLYPYKITMNLFLWFTIKTFHNGRWSNDR